MQPILNAGRMSFTDVEISNMRSKVDRAAKYWAKEAQRMRDKGAPGLAVLCWKREQILRAWLAILASHAEQNAMRWINQDYINRRRAAIRADAKLAAEVRRECERSRRGGMYY